MEIWKEVRGYERSYEVSNFGKVKSLSRVVERSKVGNFICKEKIVVPFLSPCGYYYVKLSKNGKTSNFRINRLVAIAFIENPNNKPEVNHINGNPLDNSDINLEWVSCRENSCHGKRTKNRSSKYVGVSFCKQTGKWKSTILIAKKNRTIGRYKTELEAYQARIIEEKINSITNKYL